MGIVLGVIRPVDLEKNKKARLWRVQLADCRICGDPAAVNNKSTQPTSGDGVQFHHVDELYVHGMTVDHHGGHGLNLISCYGITVSANVLAHNAGGGVDLCDAWGCAVSANTFTLDDKFGLRIGPDAGRIAVTGNNRPWMPRTPRGASSNTT